MARLTPKWIAALFSAVCLALVAVWVISQWPGTGAATKPSRAPAAELVPLELWTPRLAARVVYERNGGIYKTIVGQKDPVLLTTEGTYPRWSPGGRFIAFVRGNDMMHMTSDGRQIRTLARAGAARAVAYHPNGNEVLFTDGKTIRTVSCRDLSVSTVLEGWLVRELDVSGDGRLVATVKRFGYHVYAFDPGTGKHWKLGSGCSASLSPDGRLATNNLGGHRRLALRDWRTGTPVDHVHAPPGRTFDNHFWSNHGDWLVSSTEGERQDVFLHQISSGRAAQLTFSGDCDRPDLYVETVN